MSMGSSSVFSELSRGFARLIFRSRGTSAPAAAAVASSTNAAVSDRGWRTHASIALIFTQVAMLGALLTALDIQTAAFRQIVYIAAVGFVINHYLPARMRLGFFSLLSLGAMLIILGASPDRVWSPLPGVARTAAIVSFGLIIIGICNLSIGFWKRTVLLLLVGCAAAAVREGLVPSGSLAIIWPIVAAIFMFRTMIYLYDLSTLKDRPTFAQSLSYFFLIPNVCCNLFPVIDFKTFIKSHYAEPALLTYQRGARWMTRGLFQLLIYRMIDQLLSIKGSDVASGRDLFQFLITNSFLYLKVSGQFHLFIGLLLLFGFKLPETNHRYFLASSFTDYWRRVNIYWKDFMMKVFYYPAFFRLKHLGQTQAMVWATLWAFFVTWVLHLYQTWWLKGTASVSWPDTLFWLILAVLVLGNSLWEMKMGRRRTLATGSYSLRDAAWLSLCTAATFAIISTLWSLWSSESVGVWFHMWTFADRYTLLGVAITLACIVSAKIVIEVVPTLAPKPAGPKLAKPPAAPLWNWDAVLCGGSLALLLILIQPAVQARFTSPDVQPVKDVLATGDSAAAAGGGRGYYEQLSRADDGDRQLWELFAHRTLPQSYSGPWPITWVKDMRFFKPLESVHTQAYGSDYQTNRWGMRDREYDLAKPPGTFRIAVLGASQAMGFGVAENEMFTSLLRQQLQTTPIPAAAGKNIEVMNFCMPGYGPLGQIPVIREWAGPFKPDVIFLVAHSIDYEWVSRDLSRALREGIEIPDDSLKQILAEARVISRTPSAVAAERLKPFEPIVLKWAYAQIVKESEKIGATPVLALLPAPWQPRSEPRKSEINAHIELASGAGFAVADFSTLFDEQDPKSIILPHQYDHWSPSAHALIAKELYQKLASDVRFKLATQTQTPAPAVAPAPSPRNPGGEDHVHRH